MVKRVQADPGKTLPKENMESLPSIFLDPKKIERLCHEIAQQEGIQNYSSEHVIRGVVHLAALCIPDLQISKSLGIPKARVKAILRSKSVKEEVYRIQIQHFNRDVDQMFKRLVPAAVQTVFDIMIKKSNKETARLDAAKYIVDRAHGKPKETLDVKNDMISEVFKALHQQKNPASQEQPIDAEFEKIDASQKEVADPLEEIVGDIK